MNTFLRLLIVVVAGIAILVGLSFALVYLNLEANYIAKSIIAALTIFACSKINKHLTKS